MDSKYFDRDEHKIFGGSDIKPYPYICFEITKEQYTTMSDKVKKQLYTTDNKQIFEIRDLSKNWTGKFVAYLLLPE